MCFISRPDFKFVQVFMDPTWTGKPGKTGDGFHCGKSLGTLLRLEEKSGDFILNNRKSEKNYTVKLKKKLLEKSRKFVSQS